MKLLSIFCVALATYILAAICSPRVSMSLAAVDWTDAFVYVHLFAAYVAVLLLILVGAVVALTAGVLLALPNHGGRR